MLMEYGEMVRYAAADDPVEQIPNDLNISAINSRDTSMISASGASS
jgi:hypothetical protein